MNKTLCCVLALLSQGSQGQTPDPLQSAPIVDLRRLSGPRWDAALMVVRERRTGPLPAQADSPLALAIGRAAKKGIIELAVDGYTDILIQCQKTQSVVLTTPLLRSDAQQAHCYRF
jgi:hypothetical protein